MNAVATDEKKPASDAGVALIEIACDANPFSSFAELFHGFLERKQGLIDFDCNLPLELVRVESNFCTAGTGKLLVKLHPSDAFLAFAGAIFASNFDLSAVK